MVLPGYLHISKRTRSSVWCELRFDRDQPIGQVFGVDVNDLCLASRVLQLAANLTAGS